MLIDVDANIIADESAVQLIAELDVDPLTADNLEPGAHTHGETIEVGLVAAELAAFLVVTRGPTGFGTKVEEYGIGQTDVEVVTGGDGKHPEVLVDFLAFETDVIRPPFAGYIDAELVAHGTLTAVVETEAASDAPCIGNIMLAKCIQSFNVVGGLPVGRSQRARGIIGRNIG